MTANTLSRSECWFELHKKTDSVWVKHTSQRIWVDLFYDRDSHPRMSRARENMAATPCRLNNANPAKPKSAKIKNKSFPSNRFSFEMQSSQRLPRTSPHRQVFAKEAYVPVYQQQVLERYHVPNQKLQNHVHSFNSDWQTTVVPLTHNQLTFRSTPQKDPSITYGRPVDGKTTRTKNPKWSDLHELGAVQSSIQIPQACTNGARQKKADWFAELKVECDACGVKTRRDYQVLNDPERV